MLGNKLAAAPSPPPSVCSGLVHCLHSVLLLRPSKPSIILSSSTSSRQRASNLGLPPSLISASCSTASQHPLPWAQPGYAFTRSCSPSEITNPQTHPLPAASSLITLLWPLLDHYFSPRLIVLYLFVLVPPIPSRQQKQGTLFTLGQVTLSVSVFFLKSKSQIKWLEMERRVMVSGLGKGAGECGSNG